MAVEKDLVFEKIVASFEDKTITIDQLIEASRQSELVDKKFNKVMQKQVHSMGKEELRKMLSSDVDPSLRWVDYAPKETSMDYGDRLLSAVHRNVAQNAVHKIGLFSHNVATKTAVHQEEVKKPSDQEGLDNKNKPRGQGQG